MSPSPVVADLRSDTVSRPTPAMRRAMAEAEVGDDVLEGDPTTRRLEERVAELLGKERALFFPSGVQANQTAIAVLARWGGEAICEGEAHVFRWEEGSAAALAGVQLRPVPTPDGVLTADRVSAAIHPRANRYLPRTALVCIENTHLASGGRVIDPAVYDGVAEVARSHGLPVHLDGARLWHAVAATGRPATDFTAAADTVMVCLSKALGAPVGSMLAGPADVLEEAWRVRRRLGGAMRQSGILAAAGLHALEHHLPRLGEAHDLAVRLAAAFDATPGFRAAAPETNIVMVDLDPGVDPAAVCEKLEKHGILMLPFGPSRLRAVTHLDVDPQAAQGVSASLKELQKP